MSNPNSNFTDSDNDEVRAKLEIARRALAGEIINLDEMTKVEEKLRAAKRIQLSSNNNVALNHNSPLSLEKPRSGRIQSNQDYGQTSDDVDSVYTLSKSESNQISQSNPKFIDHEPLMLHTTPKGINESATQFDSNKERIEFAESSQQPNLDHIADSDKTIIDAQIQNTNRPASASNTLVETYHEPVDTYKNPQIVTEVLPDLVRDTNTTTIDKTLNRLKSQEITKEYIQSRDGTAIRTAISLPTNADVSQDLRQKKIILGIVLMIALTLILIAGSYIITNQRAAIIRTGTEGFGINTNMVDISVDAADSALASTNNLDQTNIYIFNNGDDRASASEILEDLGFYFPEPLLQGISSSVVVIKNNQEFAISFFTNDFPNTSRGLRQWESSAPRITQALLMFPIDSDAYDVRFNNLDYRSWTNQTGQETLVYTIENAEIVYIGSGTDFIDNNRTTLRSYLY